MAPLRKLGVAFLCAFCGRIVRRALSGVELFQFPFVVSARWQIGAARKNHVPAFTFSRYASPKRQEGRRCFARNTLNHMESHMTITAHNNTIISGVRTLIVEGGYPNGERYSDTVQASTTFEAMICVLADRRYSDDGGDLAISAVRDVATGAALDHDLIPAEIRLLTEVEAITQVIDTATAVLQSGKYNSERPSCELRAYAEYFGLVLGEAPFAFDGLTVGPGATSREDLTLEYEDMAGDQYVFAPADALLELARIALQQEQSVAAIQVRQLALMAPGSVSIAALDVFA